MHLWRYTDDVVVAMIMLTWIYGKVSGNFAVEDGYMTLALGYVFGHMVGKSIHVE